jgi:hypothetical protein
VKKILFVLFFLLIPSPLFAAQFVSEPLFLSKSPVTEGQKVHVYAIVSNDAGTAFTGTVLINADGVKLGAPVATLGVGATQTVSAVWIPSAGSHLISAALTADDGTVVQQVSHTFDIAAIPVPEPVATTEPAATSAVASALATSGYQSSLPIQQAIGSVSPKVESTAKPVFTAIDSVRKGIATTLEGQTNYANKALNQTTTIQISKTVVVTSAGTGSPSKTETLAPKVSGTSISTTPIKKVSNIFWKAYLVVLAPFQFLFSNAVVFYSILMLIFIYILWRVFKSIKSRTFHE